jgi:hypothetical protein
LALAAISPDALEALIHGMTGPSTTVPPSSLNHCQKPQNAFIRFLESHGKAWKTSSALCLLWRANECRAATLIGTPSEAINGSTRLT